MYGPLQTKLVSSTAATADNIANLLASVQSHEPMKSVAIHSISADIPAAGGVRSIFFSKTYQPNKWSLFTIATGGTACTDVSATIKAGSPVTIFVASTVTTGFAVQCDLPFSFIALTIGTGDATTRTFVPSYWNGSSLFTPTAGLVRTPSTAQYFIASATCNIIMSNIDAAKGTAGLTGTGLSSTRYTMRVLNTANTQSANVTATAAAVGEMVANMSLINGGGSAHIKMPMQYPLIIGPGEGLVYTTVDGSGATASIPAQSNFVISYSYVN